MSPFSPPHSISNIITKFWWLQNWSKTQAFLSQALPLSWSKPWSPHLWSLNWSSCLSFSDLSSTHQPKAPLKWEHSSSLIKIFHLKWKPHLLWPQAPWWFVLPPPCLSHSFHPPSFSWCSLSRPGILLPQGLCTCWSLCLESSSYRCPRDPHLSTFYSLKHSQWGCPDHSF